MRREADALDQLGARPRLAAILNSFPAGSGRSTARRVGCTSSAMASRNMPSTRGRSNPAASPPVIPRRTRVSAAPSQAGSSAAVGHGRQGHKTSGRVDFPYQPLPVQRVAQNGVELTGREGLRNAEVGADLVVGAQVADRDTRVRGAIVLGRGDEGGQGPGRALAFPEDDVNVNRRRV